MAANIFNDLIKKRKSIINELHENADKNKLYFEYVCRTKDVSFYEYFDSKELFQNISFKFYNIIVNSFTKFLPYYIIGLGI